MKASELKHFLGLLTEEQAELDVYISESFETDINFRTLDSVDKVDELVGKHNGESFRCIVLNADRETLKIGTIH
jgi:hypothetical protein